MAKAGDKFIIEIERTFHGTGNDSLLYKAKGFNTLVFDENGISKLEPYEEQDAGEFVEYVQRTGEVNAWMIAKDLIELSASDRQRLFGYSDPLYIFRMFEPQEAAEILNNTYDRNWLVDEISQVICGHDKKVPDRKVIEHFVDCLEDE